MPDTDYEVEYENDNLKGINELTINFKYTAADNVYMDKPYYVTYKAFAMVQKNGDVVSNSAKLNYLDKQTDVPPSTSDTDIIKTTGTGVITGNRVTLNVKKTGDDKKNLAGAVFQLYNEKGTVALGKPITTGNDGIANFGYVVAGKYMIKELSTLPGYNIPADLLNGKVITVSGANNSIVTNSQINYRSKVTFTKYGNSSVDKNNKTLQGVQYKIYQRIENEPDKDLNLTVTSDKNGVVNIYGLVDGSYYAKEVKTVNGYIINESPIYFFVKRNDKTESYETWYSPNGNEPTSPINIPSQINYQGAVRFYKQGLKYVDGNPTGEHSLKDAEFAIEDLQGNRVSAIVKTDATGYGTIGGIAPGTYELVETGAPYGYVLNELNRYRFTIPESAKTGDFPFIEILSDESKPVDNVMGKVAIRKVGKQNDILENTYFEIYDLTRLGLDAKTCPETGNTNPDTQPFREFKTGSNGYAAVADLFAGHNFCVRETKASPGYILNNEPILFSIPTSTSSEEDDIIVDLEITNNMGRVMINKRDLNRKTLKGAVFSLYSVDENGKEEIYKDNITVTSADFIVDDVAVGKYILKEKTPPKGYIKTNETFGFEVNGEQEDEWDVVKVDHRGYQLKAKCDKPHNAFDVTNFLGKVSIEKFDEKHAALDGATFNILDSNGKIFKSNITTKDGRVDIDNIPVGTYKVVETKAPKGYHINSATHTFTIENKVDKDNNPIPVSVEIVNYPTKVVVNKVDQDGKGLRDASFKIEDTKGNVVVKEFKMSDSKHVLDKLETGNYKLIETKAPKNYRLESKPINFTIPKAVKGQPKEIVVKAKNVLLPGKAPQTGNDNLVKWIALTIASLLLTIFGFYYRNRQHN